MKNPDELRQENEALRDRLSRLSAAVLRVSDSLDLNTVLQEVVDSGRALTGARYGVITTIDARGEAHEFVSSGLTPEEHRQLLEWPDGPRLFEYLRDLPAPLRLRDARAYVRSLGFSFALIGPMSLQGTPMRHRGTHVGNFFLGDKEGGEEFTDEDEEVLLLFAAQAATAIANACTYRDEQRARADMEALIETSPVGVVVFEARSGAAVSINQEARRIVDGLRPPGGSAEELLKVITCRRADGHEVSLAELPLAQQLSSAETVRAEEIVLSVPDGRRVKTLINATPIHSADGELESMVVTMQDLAPLEDLERMRAEFLGMVSHELRAPLAAIKGSAATALGASRRLDAAEVRQFFRIIEGQADQMDGLISDLLDAGRIETGTLSVAPEPTDVTALVDQARNTFVSGGGRHAVRIDLPPELPQVMADRQRIVQVLNNLFSNAARHSPESSPIQVAGAVDGVHVATSVTDEGRGVPPEQLPHLFRKHAGLAGGSREPRAGGYGLGLAICRGLVEAHGGRIRADSAGVGQGTRVTFTIPVAEASGGSAAAGRAASHSPKEGGKQQTSILVVDDDPQELRRVRDALVAAGYAPVVTADPGKVADLVGTHRPQLVLLDLVLPGTDGIALMQRIPALEDVPVIFISAYGGDETIATALELGAADYIVKPFSPTELTARIRAALRKRTGAEPFVLGDLAIHYEQREVTVAGRAVQLTGHRVRTAPPALGQRGAGIDLRFPAAAGVDRPPCRHGSAVARRHEAAPKKARRHGGPIGLHPHRARGRLPHAATGRLVRATSLPVSSVVLDPDGGNAAYAPGWYPARRSAAPPRDCRSRHMRRRPCLRAT